MHVFPNPLDRPSPLQRPISSGSETPFVQKYQYEWLNTEFEDFFTAPSDMQYQQIAQASTFTSLNIGLPLESAGSFLTGIPVLAESVETRWLRTHGSEIVRHRGEWLLIVNDRLAASSGDFAEIKRVIERERIESPFVYYVPTDEESNFTLI